MFHLQFFLDFLNRRQATPGIIIPRHFYVVLPSHKGEPGPHFNEKLLHMAGQTDFYNVKFDGLLQIAGIPVGYNELYHMPISRPYVFDLLQKYHRLCVQFRCFTGRVKLCLPNCAATGCVIGGTASMLGTPGLCPAKKSCGVARQACLTCHGNSIILFPDHYYTVPTTV